MFQLSGVELFFINVSKIELTFQLNQFPKALKCISNFNKRDRNVGFLIFDRFSPIS
jgi:hypothetical protein